MSKKTDQCPICRRRFNGTDSVYQHARAKHKKHNPQTFKLHRQSDDDESMASRMIDAHLQLAMGGPVDEDYLLDGWRE